MFRATLSVRPIERNNPKSMDVEVYRLKRDWAEAGVTWLNARAGVPWLQPGAIGPDDVDSTWVGQAVWTTNAWFSFDVTQLVRGWVEGTWPNHGLLLHTMASDGSIQVTYDSISSNSTVGAQQPYRPELIISYWGPQRVYLPFTQK